MYIYVQYTYTYAYVRIVRTYNMHITPIAAILAAKQKVSSVPQEFLRTRAARYIYKALVMSSSQTVLAARALSTL